MELGLGVKEAIAPGHAFAAAGAASATVLLTRYVDVRTSTTDMIFDSINRMASSPLELGLLAMLVLWLASWVLDRHARAAQFLSSLHLRLLGAAFVHTAGLSRAGLSRAAATTLAEQPSSSPPAAAQPASPQPSTSAARRRLALEPSPASKDISSFRLPDHAIAGSRARRRASAAAAAGARQPGQRAGKKQLRWSLDAAGGQPRRQQVGTQPKPRTSVDFEPSPTSPSRQTRRGASVADHRASPRLQAGPAITGSASCGAQQLAQPPTQDQARWQPSMRRITSGQELAELAGAGGAGSAHSSLDAGSARPSLEGGNPMSLVGQPEGPAQTGAEQPAPETSESVAARGDDSAATADAASVATATAVLLTWLPSLSLPLTWPASPGAAEAASDATAADPFDPGASPFSPTSAAAAAAAAAVARRVAESGTAAAAWASSTVDSMLRPLMPAGSTSGALLWRSYTSSLIGGDISSDAAAAGARPSLEHSASAPLPHAAAAAASAVDGLTGQAFASACLAACAAAEQTGRRSMDSAQRRMSLDGVSARHYSSGAVTADPSRKAALENLAHAARMQARGAAPGAPAAPAGDAAHPAAAVPSAATLGACLGPDAGTSCLASVGLDGDCPAEIRSHVTDEHLVQFAAMAGEAAAAAAAAELRLPAAWAGEGCLLGGTADGGAAPCTDDGWEQVVDRASEGLRYQVWRQELRRGLYMYRSVATFQGVAPRDLRPFHLDDHARDLWDENVLEIRRIKPSSQPGRLHKHTEWCLHQYRSRFPRPLAAREYQYARRVWHRPSDGGCYVICRGLPLPDAGDGYRAVRVTDIVSASLIRAVPGSAGAHTEMLSIYFEDSGVRPGLAKMAVKGMWAYMQSYEAALRVFAEARRAAAAEYAAAAAGSAAPRRRSQDGASSGGGERGRRRRQLLSQLAEAGPLAGGDEDAGSSSGDDTLSSAYASVARRLRRGGAAPSRLGLGGRGGGASTKARWVGRLAMLATIKMVHAMLARR